MHRLHVHRHTPRWWGARRQRHNVRGYYTASAVKRPPTCKPSHFINTDFSSTSLSFCKHFSSSVGYQRIDSNNSTAISNETNVEHLPVGITRQSDFFGESITFVQDVNENTLSFVDHSSPTQPPNQTDQTNINDDNSLLKKPPSLTDDSISDAIASFDGMSLCILSRGSANLHDGNDGDGPDARAFHSSAMAWSELLRHAWDWNDNSHNNWDMKTITAAPMLAVAAAAPAIAQGGSHYLRRIDRLLDTTRDSAGHPPSLWSMAHNAVSFRDAVLSATPEISSDNSDDSAGPVHLLTPRERWHMHALRQLLQNNHRDAMGAYLRLLELYPGDLLGLSLALDVAYTLGDANSALRAATNVSTYWAERDGGATRFQQSHPAQNQASSLIAVGLSPSSASSRASTAERLAETSMTRDSDGAGGPAVWALAHSFAAEGRSAEMVSKLATFDGTQFYEQCGYLHFHTRMKCYGGIALLDCRGAASDRAATRLYDGGFGGILEYSGNDVKGAEMGGEEVCLREKTVPRSVKGDMAASVGSMFTGWFGSDSKKGGDDTSQNVKVQLSNDSEGVDQSLVPQRKQKLQRRTIEDVLCWLPPSPLLLTHATALLFRLTLCGGISESDDRWANLRAAWTLALKSDGDHGNGVENQTPVEFMPLAMVASSLLIEPNELHLNEVPGPLQCAMQGLHKMGKLMKLGRLKMENATSQESDDSHVDDWKEVLQLLAHARDSDQRWEMPTGMSSSSYLLSNSGNMSSIPPHPIGWDFDLRQYLEHSLCYAAMEVGDYESLCLARAICSEGTTLRQNCPELWWRYGAIMDKLGDDVAAENARSASISLGSGEGASI